MGLSSNPWLSTLVVVAALTGCSVDEQVCPAVDGVYVPLYEPIAGDCGPIQSPNLVQFQGNTSGGMVMTTERRLDADVTTVVVHKGCTVRMSQTVAAKTGQLQSQIDGESIRVRNASMLQGQVDYVKFNPMSEVACHGTYNATFSKNMQIHGAVP